MTVDFQTVDVKFNTGLDTKTNKKLVAGKLTQLVNATLAKDYSVRKRDGSRALVGSLSANGLATHDGELLVVAQQAAYTIAAPADPETSIQKPTQYQIPGELGFVNVTRESLLRSTGMQHSMDCAYGMGLTCYVWNDLTSAGTVTGISYQIKDETTGAHVIAPTQLVGGTAPFCPRVVFSGNTFFIFWIAAGVLSGYCVYLAANSTIGGFGGPTALVSTDLASFNFDACPFAETGNGSVAVSYASTNATDSVRAILVRRPATNPTVFAGPQPLISQAALPVANITGIGVCWMQSSATGGGYYATFVTSTGATALSGTSCQILNSAFVQFTSAILIDNAVIGPTSSSTHVCAVGQPGVAIAACFTDLQSEYFAAGIWPIRRIMVTTNGTTISVTSQKTLVNSATFAPSISTPAGPEGPFICGKPFARGAFSDKGDPDGNLFLPVCILENYQSLTANTVNNNQQPTVYLLDGNSGNVVSRALYGRLGIAAINNNRPVVSTPCSSPAVPTGWALASTERTIVAFNNGLQVSPTGLCRLTWSPQVTVGGSRAQLGTGTYLGGGALTLYDSLQLSELGFNLFPEGISVVVVAGGGSMTAGSHAVVAVYEWIDGMGQRHQSAPSPPVTVTVSGNDRITVSTPTLLMSQKSGVSIVLYMTPANSLTLYRITAVSNPINNSTSVAQVSRTLGPADASFTGNELLYTQPLTAGTTLPNVAPSPMKSFAIHQNRLFADASDTEGGFQYSQPLQSGVGLQWSETLRGFIPKEGGNIVGWADLDDKMIILCSRKLYFIAGTGPTLAGAYNNYSDPIEIPSEVGCSERASILRMELGVIFKSLKGWFLLGRDLSVRFIGDGVAEFDSNTVTSATMLETQQECRWTSDTGPSLVFSYATGQWSTTVYRNWTGAAVRSCLVVDAIWWPSIRAYVWLDLTNGLNRDVPGYQFDMTGVSLNGYPVLQTIRTGFFHASVMEGFQRAKMLYFTMSQDPTVTPTGLLRLSVDFDDTYSGDDRYLNDFNFTGVFVAGTEVIDLRHKLWKQKCKSFAFTFTERFGTVDVTTGLTGLQAMALQVGVKRGTNKIPETQNF